MIVEGVCFTAGVVGLLTFDGCDDFFFEYALESIVPSAFAYDEPPPAPVDVGGDMVAREVLTAVAGDVEGELRRTPAPNCIEPLGLFTDETPSEEGETEIPFGLYVGCTPS